MLIRELEIIIFRFKEGAPSLLATIILTDKALILGLDFLFLLLIIPYIFHYYGLENGVQRLYKIDRELEFLTGRMNN